MAFSRALSRTVSLGEKAFLPAVLGGQVMVVKRFINLVFSEKLFVALTGAASR